MFVVARRGIPALHVILRGTRLTDLVVSTPEAYARAEEIRATLGLNDADIFTETDVTCTADQIELAGTVTTPAGVSKGLALILPGSGEVDRNADHRRIPLGVSRDLAHALARAGIRTLRYDKRGVGASGGSYLATGLHDNAADARAALAWLRTLEPEAPTFVVGHSEGGIIAEIIAADHPELAGVVLLAAPGTTGEQTLRWQAAQIARTLPAFPKAVMAMFRIDIVRQQQKAIAKIRATTADTMRMQGRKINARWQRELLAFDPADVLSRIASPVLAITGGKDLQVNPDDLAIIESTVTGAVETRRPENLTHLLREDPNAPTLSAYRKLVRKPTDVAVLAEVAGWLATRGATQITA